MSLAIPTTCIVTLGLTVCRIPWTWTNRVLCSELACSCCLQNSTERFAEPWKQVAHLNINGTLPLDRTTTLKLFFSRTSAFALLHSLQSIAYIHITIPFHLPHLKLH